MNLRRTPQKGFTLIETLVAISIITIVMTTPFYAAVRSIQAAENARDELAGSMLAQEGIEYAIKIRDDNFQSNFYAGTNAITWMHGLDGTGGTPDCFANKCSVDPSIGAGSVAMHTCASTGCTPLYLNTSGIFSQINSSGSTATRFTRSIQLTTISANEVKLTCTVSWVTNKVPYSTSASEYLQNWLAAS